jgi:5'-methylthioadenosine phosphorylase
MGRLAVVGGNATRGLDLDGAGWVALDRHQAGDGGYTLPHEIDHGANVRALAEAGCDRILGIGSVGGLQPQLGPGTFLCPDDFIAQAVGATSLAGIDAHRVIGFDPKWRTRVVEAWTASAQPPLVDGGVYWQSVGPRLETPAEVRAAARDADVIGMTLASECVFAAEAGLAYAAICVVVNYANGVGEEPLTPEEVEQGGRATRGELAEALQVLLPELAY